MRVLFVLPHIVMGGVERVTLNLIRQFQAEGIECALALAHCRGELLDEAKQLTIVHELAPAGFHQFIPRMARLLRELQPTHVIVVFHNMCLLTLLACKWARCNPMVVYGAHNSHGIEGARPGWLGYVRHLVNTRIAGFVYRRVDAIVTGSMGVNNEIRTVFGISSTPIETIYNPVINEEDARRLASLPRTNVPNVVRIVAIGRLVRQKGFDILLDAMAMLEGQREWRLDIYGDGPYRARLEHQIERLRLSEQVRLHGYTTDPLACLAEADLFVLPSRHEGLPTVLILAAACGIQIVAADCPYGPREILCDGNLGELVRPEDAPALAEGINRVLTHRVFADPAALRARARDFSIEAATLRWRELLGAGAAPS